MVQKSGSPVDMVNIPIIFRVFKYITGGWVAGDFPREKKIVRCCDFCEGLVVSTA